MSNESWWVFLVGVSVAALVYCAILFLLILIDKRKNPVTKMLKGDEALRLWVNHKKAEAWEEGAQSVTLTTYEEDGEVFTKFVEQPNPYREETKPVGGIHSHHCDDRGCLGCECDPACDDYEETE